MAKIVNTWWVIATIATGVVDFSVTAHSQTNSLLGSVRLPELNILSDTEPPLAIPQSNETTTRNSSSTAASSSHSSSTSSSTEEPSGSNSQALESTDAGYANSIHPLIIKGNRFFDSVSGDYFAIRGVNYYPRPNTGPLDINNLDLFSNDFKHIWQRDLPQFVALDANVIRLYSVDPDVDHTEFMCGLQAEGIYVIVDLGSNCEGCEITADAAPTCYPASYKLRGEKIINQFARYDNVMAFSGGNEINHRTGGNPWTWNAPCQKKFIRDMRAYIQSCPNLRQVPVGLVVADTDRDDNAQYYNCRTDASDELENAQWYGINTYVHCDDISDPTKATGFNLLRDSFKSYDYSIPVVLTEFGCVSTAFPTVDGYEAQRTFHDAKFMNMREYSDYFAGGVAFEYSTENANSMSTSPYPFKTYGPQNYGLGYFSPEDCTDAGVNCTYNRFPNFEFLKEAFESYDNSDEPTLSNYKIPSNHAKTSTCPKNSPILSKFSWEGDSSSGLACPAKADSRYQCPNIPSLEQTHMSDSDSRGSLDGSEGPLYGSGGSLYLDEINSGSSNKSEQPVTKSGGTSSYQREVISFLVPVFATLVLNLS